MEKPFRPAGLLIVALLSLLPSGCTGTRPAFVGGGQGSPAPCPATPNCVSSLAPDSMHHMEPLRYEGSSAEAMARLVRVIRSMERTKIISQTEDYLYVEFTSAFWRFVDDVEFSFEQNAKVINFRSASRLGKSDLGVNRKRMQTIRALFEAEGK